MMQCSSDTCGVPFEGSGGARWMLARLLTTEVMSKPSTEPYGIGQ